MKCNRLLTCLVPLGLLTTSCSSGSTGETTTVADVPSTAAETLTTFDETTKTVNGYMIKSGANLRGAELSRADLTYADLIGAILTYADLTSADLRYANQRGANLGRATLDGANFWNATLPDGSVRTS